MFRLIAIILGIILFSTMGLGILFLALFGALIGIIIAAFTGRLPQFSFSANPFHAQQRQAVFLETVFVLMGKLAKADGRISQVEIDHVEAFIQKMGTSAEHRQEAIRQFKRGADADFDISPTLENFMTHCGRTLNLRQVLLVYLTVMALADGKLDPAERQILEQIAGHLGYSRAEFNRILEMVLSQAHFSSGQQQYRQPGRSSASDLEDAYKALGVSKEASNQEIKRAYRKLMSQYHPDKLTGQGVPEDMIAVATEQAKEIQVAYDLIKKQRGI
jgi:DnaJ like chaperone protein